MDGEGFHEMKHPWALGSQGCIEIAKGDFQVKYMVREKRFAGVLIMISLLMISLLLLIPATEAAVLFGPRLIDVAPKGFSVVWTTDSDYSSCGIGFYTDNTYTTLRSAPGTVIVDTPDGHPGRNNHIAMVLSLIHI